MSYEVTEHHSHLIELETVFSKLALDDATHARLRKAMKKNWWSPNWQKEFDAVLIPWLNGLGFEWRSVSDNLPEGGVFRVHESFVGDLVDPGDLEGEDGEWFLAFSEYDLFHEKRRGRSVTKSPTKAYDNLCKALGNIRTKRVFVEIWRLDIAHAGNHRCPPAAEKFRCCDKSNNRTNDGHFSKGRLPCQRRSQPIKPRLSTRRGHRLSRRTGH